MKLVQTIILERDFTMAPLLFNTPIIDTLNTLFTEHNIVALAVKHGIVQRKPRKIDPHNFLLALFLTVMQQATSLRKIALMLGSMKNILISKQAIDKRINERFVQFLEPVLAGILAHKIKVPSPLSSLFNRIIVQDSSSVRLPDSLAKEFSGSKNGKGKTYAILKIQTMYDLLKEQFCHFRFTPFTTNDQAAATTESNCFEENDLIIRDLGYFGFDGLTSIISCKAFFISRLRFGVALADPHSGKRIKVLTMVKKYHTRDIPIMMGSQEKLSVRLIAVPVDPVIAAERRRKLKNNRDRRLHPSKEHLALLGWNVFITNVHPSILSPEEVLSFYQLRWRIEIIFKSWKSNFHLTSIPHASAIRVKAYLLVFFILVTLFHACLVMHDATRSRNVSLLKLSRLLCEQLIAIFFFYQGTMSSLWEQIHYHCAYEKRKDRLNYYQKFALLS